MINQNRSRTCCLVVGMHNSGTSLAGALLYGAGLPMGHRLLRRKNIEPSLRPRYDYFEDQDVVAMQENHLQQLKRHWSSYRSSFTLPDQDSPLRIEFRRALTGLIKRRFRIHRLWVVKDPRTAVLLDDWVTVLDELEITTKLMIVHRDPTSNIRSFSRKGQVPPLWAEALWQRTYINALNTAETLPSDQVSVVRFKDLLESPLAEANKACTFLNYLPPKKLEQRVAQHFDASLPTESADRNSGINLHPTTRLIQGHLDSTEASSKLPEETLLLSSEMSSALAEHKAPLELNALYCEGQSLLPKLRITIVTAELQGWNASGGIGSAYLELALALTEAGHQVRVVLVTSTVHTPKSLHPNLSVEQFNPSGLSRLEQCRGIANQLQPDIGDVIHLHDWLGLGSGLKSALGPNCPQLIVGLHGPSAWTRSGNPWPKTADGALATTSENLYEEGLIQALEQDLIETGDLLISPSKYMGDWVAKNILRHPMNSDLVIQRNCPLSHRRLKAYNKDLSLEHNRLIYFGRLEERKGLLLFLEALKLLNKKPAEVVFLGGDCRISERYQGSTLAKERLGDLEIPSRFFTTLQRVEALEKLQDIHGVVVIPSLIENSPCVLEELLDSGLQVVSTNVGGSKELVATECVEWLSDPNPIALAKHLQAALKNPTSAQYRLKARVPGWKIQLSWQAFHERLPRPEQLIEPHRTGVSFWKHVLKDSQRKAKAMIRRLKLHLH